MVVEDGYEFYNDRTLVTVFSAPKWVFGRFEPLFGIAAKADVAAIVESLT